MSEASRARVSEPQEPEDEEPQSYPFVEIEWDDTVAESGWKTEIELDDLGVDPVYSRGWLVRNTDTHIAVAATYSGRHYNQFMVIPKGMVRNIRNLPV